MARLNVEPSIFIDQRFIDLMIRLGGMEVALGAVIRAWLVGQKYYLIDDGLIPAEEWTKQRLFDEIIDVGLAERVGDRIRIKGSEEQFGWLRACSEAGKRSAEKKAGSRSLKVRQGSLTDVQPPLKEVEVFGKGVETSLEKNQGSSTSSSSSKCKDKKKNTKGRSSIENPPDTDASLRLGEAAPPLPANAVVESQTNLALPHRGGGSGTENVQRFMAAYVSAYQRRFPGQRPSDLDLPKVRGQIKAYAKDHPDIDRACELIQVYLQLDRTWFRTKGWDFLTFVSNLNSIAQAADAGVDPESGDALFANVAKRFAAAEGGSS